MSEKGIAGAGRVTEGQLRARAKNVAAETAPTNTAHGKPQDLSRLKPLPQTLPMVSRKICRG